MKLDPTPNQLRGAGGEGETLTSWPLPFPAQHAPKVQNSWGSSQLENHFSFPYIGGTLSYLSSCFTSYSPLFLFDNFVCTSFLTNKVINF